MNKKTCLVSGITGMIGRHLLGPLSRYSRVVGIVRNGAEARNGLATGLDNIVSIDLAGKDGFDVCVPDVCVRDVGVRDVGVRDVGGSTAWDQKAEVVIHLAQSEFFREFPGKAQDVFRVNTLSTLQLLDFARKAGAEKFILASSGGIYGYGDHEFQEDVTLSARDDLGFYLGTKLCAEVIAESYAPYMDIIILRFFFVYGPGQRRSMLIPRLVQSVLAGHPITLQQLDGLRINPTYVTDAVRAVMQALQLSGSHKINIAGPEILSLRRIGEIIGRQTGKEPIFQVQPEQSPRHLVGDIGKMSRMLTAPTVTFAQGVGHVIKQMTTSPPQPS